MGFAIKYIKNDMKRKFLFLIMAFVSVVAFGQNWTRETVKDYKKEVNVALVVDFSEATVMDVKLEDFPEYFSGRYGKTEKYASLVLEKFKNRFASNYFKASERISVPVEEARFVITYNFNSINENGGFHGVFWICDGDNKSEVVPFKQKDGRWNEFEVLLMENVDKFWESHIWPTIDGIPIESYLKKLESKKK